LRLAWLGSGSDRSANEREFLQAVFEGRAVTTSQRITILGCGSSTGVPRVGGDWGACDPNEPRNRRLRCGLLIEQFAGAIGQGEATTVLIDTPPDLRAQLLAADVRRLDAILYTHDHADQSHGIDDVRPIFHTRRAPIPTFMDGATHATLAKRFAYVFEGGRGYPPVLELQPMLKPGQDVTIDGPGGRVQLTPLLQDHGTVMSLGFRFGDVAYSNDLVRLPDESLAALHGLQVWMVDALRYTAHPTHANVEQALAWIAALKPKRAILTNLHIDLDYQVLKETLPAGVEPAFDGLQIEIHSH
jgi:phosphoribosyl 1,2-cyclic phosphate phosphodiesterase